MSYNCNVLVLLINTLKHLVVRCSIFLLQSCAMSSKSGGCEHDCSRNGDQSKKFKSNSKGKTALYLTTLLPEDVYVMHKLHSICTFQNI